MENDGEPPKVDNDLQRKIAEIESTEAGQPQPAPETTPMLNQAGVFSSGGGWRRWLRSWKFWLIAVSVIALASLVTLWFIPVTRYMALNLFGVKASVIVKATETTNGSIASVKNFSLQADNRQFIAKGVQIVVSLPFGPQTLTVSKPDYKQATKQLTVDLDPFFGLLGPRVNNTFQVSLQADGTTVSFRVVDTLSGTPLSSGSFTLGDKVVTPNAGGMVSIVVPRDKKTLDIAAAFGGSYLDKTITIDSTKTDQVFQFVPAGRHYYVMNQGSTYNIYSANLDGSDAKQFLAGTPQETASLLFAVSPDGTHALMASTREGTRDASGNLLQKLYLVNLKTATLDVLDQGTAFTFYDWSDQKLVYSYSAQIAGTTTPTLRLRAVDSLTKNTYDLGSASTAYDRVALSGQTVLALRHDTNGDILQTSSALGANQKDLATGVTELRQMGSDQFVYQTLDKKWLTFQPSTNQVKDTTAPTTAGRIFLNLSNPKQTTSRIVLDIAAGQTILSIQSPDGKEQKVTTVSGLSGPVRWINDTTITYRVIGGEVADYAVSTLGGSPKKIAGSLSIAPTSVTFFRYY